MDRVAAFIFDLDGTLVASGTDIARSANHVRWALGLPPLAEATARSYVGDGVVRLLERALGHDDATGRTGPDGRPVAPDELRRGLALFADHYGAHLLDTTVPYPGVPETLRALSGVPLLVATNKPRAFTDRILEGLHVADAFRRVVGGDEAPARKPDPAHLAAVLEGLDVAPSRVAMVGDSPNDVLAAKAFGAVAVGCTYGLVSPGRVRAAEPDLVIDSFAELGEMFPARPA